uniref:Uncharacterized protein n=1 Tax=Setaria italica TaxID=4555 RepID=K3XTX5_SETIT
MPYHIWSRVRPKFAINSRIRRREAYGGRLMS